MTTIRKGDSHEGGLKGIRNICQLMERCDGQGEYVRVCGKVWQLSRGVAFLVEV